MANKTDYAIIILAAGASHRFGRDKLLTLVAGKRLIDWSIETAVASNLGTVLVVTNPNRHLDGFDPVVSVITNFAWCEGLSSSIRCGLQALAATTCRAAIFTPGDQPLLTAEVYRRIIEKFQQQSFPLIVASYDGQPRNPVLLDRALWKKASCIQGDIGLSALTRSESQLVECGDIASVADVDEPVDLIAVEAMLLYNSRVKFKDD